MRVEDAFIADDSNFEQLEIAEEGLIDAYVKNELSPLERRQFESRLLTSQRIVDRVNFARALAHKAGAEPSQESDHLAPVLATPKVKWWEGFFGRQAAFPTALAASVALILIGVGFILFSWFQLRSESDRIASERMSLQKQREETDKLLLEQHTRNEQMAAGLQRERESLVEERRQLDAGQEIRNQPDPGGLSGTTIVSLMLSPGLVRDSNAQQQLAIGAGVSSVQLKLVLGSNEYRTYLVTVADAKNRPAFTRSGLTARKAATGHLIGLLVPAKKLEPGIYVVTVRGRLPNGDYEDVEEYIFRISK